MANCSLSNFDNIDLSRIPIATDNSNNNPVTQSFLNAQIMQSSSSNTMQTNNGC